VSPSPTEPTVTETLKLKRYAVVGASFAQLEHSAQLLGPRAGGRNFPAYADYRLSWSYVARVAGLATSSRQACEVVHEQHHHGVAPAEVCVHAEFTLTLPRWTDARLSQNATLRRRWARFLRRLRAHEHEHLRAGRRAAHKLGRSIAATPPQPDSATLERAVAERVKRVQAQLRDDNHHIDHRATHL